MSVLESVVNLLYSSGKTSKKELTQTDWIDFERRASQNLSEHDIIVFFPPVSDGHQDARFLNCESGAVKLLEEWHEPGGNTVIFMRGCLPQTPVWTYFRHVLGLDGDRQESERGEIEIHITAEEEDLAQSLFVIPEDTFHMSNAQLARGWQDNARVLAQSTVGGLYYCVERNRVAVVEALAYPMNENELKFLANLIAFLPGTKEFGCLVCVQNKQQIPLLRFAYQWFHRFKTNLTLKPNHYIA